MSSTSQGARLALPAVCRVPCAVVVGLRGGRTQLARDTHQARLMSCWVVPWLCWLPGPGTRVPGWKYSLALKQLNLYTPQEKLRHEGHCSVYLHQHGTNWHV